MKPEDLYETIPLRSAESFYLHLSPNHRVWRGREWLYRGQSDSKKLLIPSAWRKNAWGSLGRLKAELRAIAERAIDEHRTTRGGVDLSESKLQALIDRVTCVLAEIESVRQFGSLADELGLHIKESPHHYDKLAKQYLHEPFDFYLKSPGKAFHFPSYSQALAQHHGLPTRLLDWTLNARKAAYFAAQHAVEKNLKRGHMAVFALDRKYAKQTCGLALLQVPREQFAFLHAQEGVFVYVVDQDEPGHGACPWPDVASVLSSHRNFASQKPIVRLRLPVTNAPALLRLLERERITEANLKPTYENIKKSLEFRWKL